MSLTGDWYPPIKHKTKQYNVISKINIKYLFYYNGHLLFKCVKIFGINKNLFLLLLNKILRKLFTCKACFLQKKLLIRLIHYLASRSRWQFLKHLSQEF